MNLWQRFLCWIGLHDENWLSGKCTYCDKYIDNNEEEDYDG